jgi:hypothetical protein
MKILFATICIAFVLTSLSSCVYVDENGIPPRGSATRTFDFKNFDALEMGSAFRVHVTQGSVYEISATGEQNDLDDLEFFVQDGKLVARYDKSWSRSRQRMDIDIVMPTISDVNFSGAVKADISGFDNLSKMDFELSGASNVDFEGSVKELEFDVSGASQLDLYGDGQFLDGELSGASELNSYDMMVSESDIDVSGASSAKVWVTKFLKVDASGASKVRYKGNPSVQKQLSGGSTLRQE